MSQPRPARTDSPGGAILDALVSAARYASLSAAIAWAESAS